MYITDTFYVEALAGMADIKITEVTQYQGLGTGATSPAPSWLSGDDFVEITNLGSAPADISGYVYHRKGSSASYDINYNLPAIVLAPGELIVLATYGATSANPANNFYIAANNSLSSNTPTGHWISDPQGVIIDAVALNSYDIVANTIVTAADWSGNIASSSGLAGVIRTVSDNNIASDWSISSASLIQSLGSFNPQLPLSGGGGGA